MIMTHRCSMMVVWDAEGTLSYTDLQWPSVDDRQMTTAENDHQLLCNAHRNRTDSRVTDHKDICMIVGTACRQVQKQVLNLVVLEGEIQVEPSDWREVQQQAHYSSPTGYWYTPKLSSVYVLWPSSCRVSLPFGQNQIILLDIETHVSKSIYIWCLKARVTRQHVSTTCTEL